MTTTGELLRANSTAPDGSTALVHLQNQSGVGGGGVAIASEVHVSGPDVVSIIASSFSVQAATITVASPSIVVIAADNEVLTL